MKTSALAIVALAVSSVSIADFSRPGTTPFPNPVPTSAPNPVPTMSPLPPPVDCRNPDFDGDGSAAVACGGNDCDDNDRTRYPGAAEVCDRDGKDEDCDLRTYGTRDQDVDGFHSSRCFNKDASGRIVSQGDDYDDLRYAVKPGVQVCLPDGFVGVLGLRGVVSREACGAAGSCIPQPNGTGICIR